jgi:deoxyuridine 5'-triphosphate nucleotidohydrolase
MSTAPPEAPPLPLQVKLLSSAAKPPSRSSAFAAGYDLYASKAATVPAWGKVMVDTDISVAVPSSTYGRVAPRSGLASKHSIHTGAGVIDADYRGPVKVLLFNLCGDDFKVEAGDRIAQLIVERVRSTFQFEINVVLTVARYTHQKLLSWISSKRQYVVQAASDPQEVLVGSYRASIQRSMDRLRLEYCLFRHRMNTD